MSDKLVNITLKLNDKVTANLRKVQKNFDGFTKSKFAWAETLSKSFGALSKAAGVPKLTKSTGELAKSLSNVGKESVNFGKSLGMLIGGSAAGAAGIIAIAKSTEAFAGHLVDNVKRIGFNVEAYQELQYAAKKSGVSTEDFDKSMQKMTRSLGEAKAGQGALYSFLSKTNPELLKQVQSAKNNEEAFSILTGALGSLKDASKQAAFANIVFGKSGANFTNLANAGAEGIKELRNEARALGIMTEEQVMGADSLGDTFDALEQIFASVKNTIGAALIPIIKQLGEEFISFYKTNKSNIDEFINSFKANVPEIISTVKDIFMGVVNATKTIITVFKFFGDNLGYANTVILLLAGTIGSGLVAALLLAGKAFIGLGITMMTTPIGWLLGGIAAIVGAIYLLWSNFDKIIGLIVAGWSNLIGVISSINPIFDLVLKGLSYVSENWDKIFDNMIQKFSSLKNLLPSWLGGGAKSNLDINHTEVAQSTVRNIQESQSIKNESEIRVSFDNMPKGARVESKGSSNVETDIRMGLMATGTI